MTKNETRLIMIFEKIKRENKALAPDDLRVFIEEKLEIKNFSPNWCLLRNYIEEYKKVINWNKLE